MSARASGRLAWALAVLAPLLVLTSIVLNVMTPHGGSATSAFFAWTLALTFAAIGRLIAARQPANAIGWLFLVAGVAAGLGVVASGYADYWVDTGNGPALLGRTAAWYGSLSWIPWILLPSTFLLLLFPDGHLLSPRWRRVAWCAGIGMAGGFVTQALTPGALEDYPHVTNPYAVDIPVLEPLNGLCLLLVVVGVIGSSASLIVRFRRARGELREQIKWLAFAGAIAGVTFPVALALSDVIGTAATNVAIMLSVLCLPLAAGIAILRYRLYDIDVVINRALVYGALTATLAGCYLGAVLLLQLVLDGVTQGSGLAVASSTLAVAALFRPARARIQEAVDRRFYRRKYDAQQTLESFSARLRDEVALEALSAELRAVVGDAMQPAHVSLWLRAPADAP
jgi:hypothetical protein